MRILLFITSIYNTFEDINKEKFESIIKKLENIADIEQDQIILFSFCDETENRNILTSFYRTVSECIEYRNIYFGRQFLGNLYYDGIINGGSYVYNNSFNKAEQIFKYYKDLESQEKYINLYYIDSIMNEDEVNNLFKNEFNINLNLIKAINTQEIINNLDNILKEKKSLEYKYQ